MSNKEEFIDIVKKTFRGGKFESELKKVGLTLDKTVEDAIDAIFPNDAEGLQHEHNYHGKRMMDL